MVKLQWSAIASVQLQTNSREIDFICMALNVASAASGMVCNVRLLSTFIILTVLQIVICSTKVLSFSETLYNF